MAEIRNEDITEIKESISDLTTKFAVLNNNIERQGATIEKLTTAFEKLSVFIEKTNENDKKIETLFKKVDNIYVHGTKNCPLSINRIEAVEKKVDKLNGYLIGILIAIAMQVFSVLIYLIEKHII